MFISSLYRSYYLNCIKALSGREYILDALQNGEYDIYYSLSSDEDTMSYYALLRSDVKDNRLPSCIGAAVTAKGNVPNDVLGMNNPEIHDFATKSLLVYLFQKEDSMKDPSTQYSDIADIYRSLSHLTEVERKQRRAIRQQFLDMVEGFRDEKSTKDSIISADSLYELEFSFFTYGKNYEYALRIKSQSKWYKILDIDEFIEAYSQEGEYTLSNGTKLSLTKQNFLPPYDEVMDELLKAKGRTKMYFGYKKGNSFIDETGFLNLLCLLRGYNIAFSARTYHILPDYIPASVSLNEKGELEFTPDIKQDDDCEYLVNGKFFFIIDSDTRNISILEYESASICQTFYFFFINGTDSFEYVSDIFRKKALPKISSSLVKRDAKATEDSALKISLYVDFDEMNNLNFKTTYLYQGEDIAKEALMNNPFYQVIIESYLTCLESLSGLEEGTVSDEQEVLNFLTADLTQLKKTCDIYLSEELKKLSVVSNTDFSIKVSSGQDWLSVKVESEKYSPEQLQQLLAALKKKKKFFILNDEAIMLSDENLANIAALQEELKLNDQLENERVPYFEALKLKSYEDEHLSIDMDDFLKEAIQAIADFKNRELVEMASSFNQFLRSYQYDAIKWMRVLSDYKFSGILADDMGLGKTLETIAYISTLQEEGPIIIITPKSLVYNWDSEFRKWAPQRERILIEGSKQDRKKKIATIDNSHSIVYVTSYDSMRNDQDLYEGKEFVLAVIDEAQYIKNAKTKKSKAVKTIEAKHKFALTGTPIENSLADLWSIFDFLMPGYFPSYDKFSKMYEGETDKKADLMKKVTPFILRRRKEDVLDSLPPKTLVSIEVGMNDKQEAIYQAYLKKARNELGDETSRINFLAALTRLRQLCVDPSTFLEDYDEISGKLSYTLTLIEESIANGHKILLFSSFTKVLDHLRELLDEQDIRSYYINGTTSASLRVTLAEKFNNRDDVCVMLVSLKAGGTGLNLQGADTVIHLDPWWNMAAEDQATDRAYRIGQTRPVTVYKLISHDSVEEKVINLQETKKNLFDSVVSTGDENISRMTLEDMRYILS